MARIEEGVTVAATNLPQLSAGVEFVWQAGPAWPCHASPLFPIVGRLANDELRHRGKTYRMTQHGFARDSRFA
ncbi:hypothetical protein XI09_29550 [Bradyrhizobium sp. CCBAU 11386]|nr:hypothetical protein [Bradyrhizobium sp. CCBAU 11386]